MLNSLRILTLSRLLLPMICLITAPAWAAGDAPTVQNMGYEEEAATSISAHQVFDLGENAPKYGLTIISADTPEEAFRLLREAVARNGGDPAQAFKNTETLNFVGEESDRDVVDRLLPKEISEENRNFFQWTEDIQTGASVTHRLDRKIASSKPGAAATEVPTPSSRIDLLRNYNKVAPTLSQVQIQEYNELGAALIKTHFEKSPKRWVLVLVNGLAASGATLGAALISTNVHWGMVLENSVYSFIVSATTMYASNTFRDFSKFDQTQKLKNYFLSLFGKATGDAAPAVRSTNRWYEAKFFGIDLALNWASRMNTKYVNYGLLFPGSKVLENGTAALPHDYRFLPGLSGGSWFDGILFDGTVLAIETTYTQGYLNGITGDELYLRNLPYAVQIGHYQKLLETTTDPALKSNYEKIIQNCLKLGSREYMNTSLLERIGTFNWIASLMMGPEFPILSRLPTGLNFFVGGGLKQYFKSRRLTEGRVLNGGDPEEGKNIRNAINSARCRAGLRQAVDRVKGVIRPLLGKKP